MYQYDDIITNFVDRFYRDREGLEKTKDWMDKKLRELLKQDPRIGGYTLESRVKSHDSLETKLQDRARKQGPYTGLNEIYADVKDLVALRIALPSYIQQLGAVQDIVRNNFDWAGETPHPKPDAARQWYTAYHFQVMVDYPTVSGEKLLIEIQVMSPTMYQVMEAEHDLLYKQLHDEPTAEDEARIERMYNSERQIAEESKKLGLSLQNRQTSTKEAGIEWGSVPKFASSDFVGRPPEQVKMKLECHYCRTRMPETTFHYFCSRRGDANTLQSPRDPISKVAIQIQVGQDGLPKIWKLPLQSLGPTSLLPEIRNLLNIPASSKIGIHWQLWNFELRVNLEFKELDQNDLSAMNSFYITAGLYGRLNIRVFVSEQAPSSSFRKSIRGVLTGSLHSRKSDPTLPPYLPTQQSTSTVIRKGCYKYKLCQSCFLSNPRLQFCPDHGEQLSKRRIDPYTELVISQQDSKVVKAIKQENIRHLEMALENGESQSLNDIDQNGLTPMHLVARSGWHRGAKLLLQVNASTESRDSQDFTPLMTAVRYGQKDIVQLLLEPKRGVNVNATTHWDGQKRPPGCTSMTSLHLAAFGNDSKLVTMLLEKGADTSINARSKKGSPLGIAATQDNMAVVEVLVKAGANPNETGILIWKNSTTHGRHFSGSLLHFAAKRDVIKLIELLCISKQLIIDNRNKTGITPLILAAKSGNLKACQVLVNSGANVNAKSASGLTPLMAAIESGKEDIVMFLVNRSEGAKVSYVRTELQAQGEPADSPLSVAAAHGRYGLVEYLLKKGADPRMPNYPGENFHWGDLEFNSDVSERTRKQILNQIRHYKSTRR